MERLKAGIQVAGCTYRVLGGSSSLVREHGYYLWAQETRGVDAGTIRNLIGNLHLIRNRAKYVARLGLAFSNTPVCIPIEERWIIQVADVQGGRDPDGNPYTFSDGIGKISQAIAKSIPIKVILETCFTKITGKCLPGICHHSGTPCTIN